MAADERSGRLLVGAARTDISPPVGGLLQSGALGVRSQGVLDRLFATAAVLDDGATRLVLVGCDVMDFEAPLAARVRRAVEARTGIPGGHVLLNASHTHSGPAVYLSESPDSPFLTPADREYVDWLIQRLADTVAQACVAGRPATLRVGSAEGAFAANRRGVNPDGSAGPRHAGAVDHRVRVLRFDDLNGASLAILFSYACHPTGFDYRRTRLITGDYVSAARAEIERAFAADGQPVVGFLQGCGGNTKPNTLEPDGAHFHACAPDELRAHGRALGAVAVQAARASRPLVGTPLQVAETTVALPLQTPPTDAALHALLADGALAGWMRPWAEALLARLERGEALGTEAPLNVQVLRLGGLCLVAMGAEVFVEIGLQIEQALRARHPGLEVLTLGYSNGEVGYVCTERAYAEGGYEPQAYRWYLAPAPFRPDSERLVVDQAVRIAGELLAAVWTG